jgi:hypothetical protein
MKRHALLVTAGLLFVVAAAATAVSPFPPPVAPGTWQWVPIVGSKCMSGEETGVWLRYGPDGLAGREFAIYLSGGGACFNLETCLGAAHTAKPGKPPGTGIFDATRSDNPFQNYSWALVPYCTGDVHTGNRTGREGGALRHFSGAANLRLLMPKAVATFSATEVFVLTGESAGGFGAISTYDLVRSYWSPTKVRGVLLDDSGPVLDDQALAPCLQQLWRQTWALTNALPGKCPCAGTKGGLSAIWNYTAMAWPNDTIGLISSIRDGTISTFFAYGELDCLNVIAPGVCGHCAPGALHAWSEGGVPLRGGTCTTHLTQPIPFSCVLDAITRIFCWLISCAPLDGSRVHQAGRWPQAALCRGNFDLHDQWHLPHAHWRQGVIFYNDKRRHHVAELGDAAGEGAQPWECHAPLTTATCEGPTRTHARGADWRAQQRRQDCRSVCNGIQRQRKNPPLIQLQQQLLTCCHQSQREPRLSRIGCRRQSSSPRPPRLPARKPSRAGYPRQPPSASMRAPRRS